MRHPIEDGPALRPEPETAALVRPLVGHDMADVEKALILETLAACAGNRTHAAQILGLSVRTIHNKLRQWRQWRLLRE